MVSDRRDALLEGAKAGNFLEKVYRSSLADSGDGNELAVEVASLHNEGLVDVVAAFEDLKKHSAGGGDFFLTRHVFEKALPLIDAPVPAVMRCALKLYRDAGQDMAAGMIIRSFIEFCAKNESRPRETLAAVEANPDEFADLLVAALDAGSRMDNPRYLSETIRLAGDPNIQLRRQAVFAMGRLSWPENTPVPDSAYSALEQSREKETDDRILAGVVQSAFALWQRDKASEQRAVALVSSALAKGDEYTLHGASELFAFSTKELSSPWLDTLTDALVRVKPENKGTLDNIDHGIDHLLRSGEQRGIAFLERLLAAHPDALTLPIFDSVMHTIAQSPTLMGKLATRWFLKGDGVLCAGLFRVTRELHGANVTLAIDPSELVPKDHFHIVFVAKKAVGYLLSAPLMAASIIVSLMRETSDGETLEALKGLLLDPLLLNYPGLAKSYLANEAKKGDGAAEATIADAIGIIEGYLEMLHAIGPIAELHPSEEQREAHMRHFSREVTESFKEAEKQSVFLSLISKSVLLYGRKSIDRVYAPGGESRRMETKLHSHSTTIDYPRMENIDPVGLDYVTRAFRVERIRK